MAFVLLTMFCVRCPAAPEVQARPSFKSLRYNEDYSFLADPAQRTDWWDAVKYVPIAGGGAGFVSFGGEGRERFEAYQNEYFSPNPNVDNAYFLQPYLFHVDYDPTEWLYDVNCGTVWGT